MEDQLRILAGKMGKARLTFCKYSFLGIQTRFGTGGLCQTPFAVGKDALSIQSDKVLIGLKKSSSADIEESEKLNCPAVLYLIKIPFCSFFSLNRIFWGKP